MAEFDRYGDNYSETVNHAIGFSGLKVDFFTRVKGAYLLDLARRELGRLETLDVLDVGCGVGNIHPSLRGRVGSLTGVDPSDECLERARASNPRVSYQSYDGDSLPLEDGRFDLAFAICVMHHVAPEKWVAFTAEMARVVRPGGLVAIVEHNPRNPLTRRVVNNCEFDRDAVLLTSKKTLRLLKDAGLERARRRYILSIPAAGRFLRLLDGALSPLGLGAQYIAWGKKPPG